MSKVTKHYDKKKDKYTTYQSYKREEDCVDLENLSEHYRAEEVEWSHYSNPQKHILHLYAGRGERHIGAMTRMKTSERLVDLSKNPQLLDVSDEVTLFNVKVYTDDEPGMKSCIKGK